MSVKAPQQDKPPCFGGGSDAWDSEVAGPILLADYFSYSSPVVPLLVLRRSYAAHAKTIPSVEVWPGDLVVVGLYQDGVQVDTSCADSAGNTYSKAAEQHITDGAGCGIYLYYAVAGAKGTVTVTGTMAGSGYNSIFVHVYGGGFNATPLHAFDSKGETVRGTAHTGAQVTTTVPDAVLFSLWGEPSGSGTISENGAGFIEREEDAGTGSYDRIVSEIGAYADAVTSTNSTAMASILAAFTLTSGPVEEPTGPRTIIATCNFGTLRCI